MNTCQKIVRCPRPTIAEIEKLFINNPYGWKINSKEWPVYGRAVCIVIEESHGIIIEPRQYGILIVPGYVQYKPTTIHMMKMTFPPYAIYYFMFKRNEVKAKIDKALYYIMSLFEESNTVTS